MKSQKELIVTNVTEVEGPFGEVYTKIDFSNGSGQLIEGTIESIKNKLEQQLPPLKKKISEYPNKYLLALSSLVSIQNTLEMVSDYQRRTETNKPRRYSGL